jgi:hypothetical protein
MQGKSFVEEEDSPLEGASPAEIEALVCMVRRSQPPSHLAFGNQWAQGVLEDDPYDVSWTTCLYVCMYDVICSHGIQAHVSACACVRACMCLYASACMWLPVLIECACVHMSHGGRGSWSSDWDGRGARTAEEPHLSVRPPTKLYFWQFWAAPEPQNIFI